MSVVKQKPTKSLKSLTSRPTGYLSILQASQNSSLTRAQLTSLIRRKILPAKKLKGRWYLRQSALKAYQEKIQVSRSTPALTIKKLNRPSRNWLNFKVPYQHLSWSLLSIFFAWLMIASAPVAYRFWQIDKQLVASFFQLTTNRSWQAAVSSWQTTAKLKPANLLAEVNQFKAPEQIINWLDNQPSKIVKLFSTSLILVARINQALDQEFAKRDLYFTDKTARHLVKSFFTWPMTIVQEQNILLAHAKLEKQLLFNLLVAGQQVKIFYQTLAEQSQQVVTERLKVALGQPASQDVVTTLVAGVRATGEETQPRLNQQPDVVKNWLETEFTDNILILKSFYQQASNHSLTLWQNLLK